MKKNYLILTTFLLIGLQAFTQKDYLHETVAQKNMRMEWWRDASFGMFIHWGAYSVPAGIYAGQPVTTGNRLGEWIMNNAKIPIKEYEQFVKQFNPQQFNAKEWVSIAKQAGMKYIVITSKHHDGFCLWDSRITTYDIMDYSPFKRDILKELSVACKEANIKLCFYYSILDWHQPDAKSVEYNHQDTKEPNFSKYREQYMKPQLAELISKYDPELFWFDGEWIPEWTEEQGRDLYNFLRRLKPSLIINNRVGKGRNSMQGMNKFKEAVGDFGTPEQEILEQTADSDWESCMTINDTWGFKKNDSNWKPIDTLIHNLIDIAAKGGNYLLNVGPTPAGLIPESSTSRLLEVGKWLSINGEAIYNSGHLRKYKEGENIKFTTSKNGQIIYAILTKQMKELRITTITPKKGTPVYMLGVKQPLSWKQEKDGFVIQLPEQLPGEYAWVLKIERQLSYDKSNNIKK